MSFINVLFKRVTTAIRGTEAIQDGKILLDYERPSIYVDNGSTRVELTPRDTALSTTSTNAIANNALTNSIINTTAEVNAITADNIPCGTKPVKELNTSLLSVTTYVGSDGKLHFTDSTGADSVLPFSRG